MAIKTREEIIEEIRKMEQTKKDLAEMYSNVFLTKEDSEKIADAEDAIEDVLNSIAKRYDLEQCTQCHKYFKKEDITQMEEGQCCPECKEEYSY